MIILKKFSDLSIRTKLILVFFITILLTSVVISLLAYNAAENTVSAQSDELIKAYLNQTVNRFDFFMESMLRASMSITFNKDINKMISRVSDGSYEDNNYFLRATDLVTVFNNTNRYIYSMRIYDFKHNIVISSKSSKTYIDANTSEYKLVKGYFIDNDKAYTILHVWIENRKVDMDNRKLQVFTLLMPIKDDYSSKVIGCLATYITEEQINKIYKGTSISKGGSVVLVNESGKVISASDKKMLNQDLSECMEPGNNESLLSKKEDVNGEEYLVTYAKTEFAGWGFLSLVPVKELMQKNTGVLKNSFFLIFGVTILLIFIISFIFNLYFYKPVRYLVNNIKLHGTEQSLAKPMVSRNDEIGFIFNSFQEVFSENKELMKNVYEQKLRLKDAEIRLLHSQINPHFLYNSLDSIIWMSAYKKYEDIKILVKEMVKFFRISLDKGNEIIKVSQAREQIESYFAIQKIRYADRLKVEIDFDEGILNYKILKLLLQPIVENSICHGIEKKVGNGFVKVGGKQKGDILIFSVEDNGIGVSRERLSEVNDIINSEVRESENFSALQNINRRVKLFYGDSYGLKLDSHEGEGTTVTLAIPVL